MIMVCCCTAPNNVSSRVIYYQYNITETKRLVWHEILYKGQIFEQQVWHEILKALHPYSCTPRLTT
jgi:hypothetical protein